MSGVAGRTGGRLLHSRTFRVGGSAARLWPGGAGAAPASYTAWNPLDKSAEITLSNSNLTATSTVAATHGVRSVKGNSAGKWYLEYVPAALGTYCDIGISNSSLVLDTNYVGQTANGWGLFSSGLGGGPYHSAVNLGLTTGYTAGQTVQLALDMDNGKVWWGINNTWLGGGDPAAGTLANYTTGITGTLYATLTASGSAPASVSTVNFGASAFTYTPPTGFTGWTV